jgi:predicted nucleotidyltransferase
VALLQALGVVDWLSFGSECGDGDLLRRAAALAESPGVQSAMRTRIGEGASFARAREEALRDVDPSAAAALRRPNDTLAVEYLSAMDCLGADMRPMAVLRRGAGHDGILPEGKAAEAEKIYPSASELRKIYRSGEEETAPSPELRKISQRGTPVLPGDLTAPWIAEDLTNGRAPVDMARLNAALLARWRTMLPADFARLPDVSEGIEHLLSRAVREGRSPDEILEMACGRRYPRARLRRILFHAFLGIEAADLHGLPPYLAVLGCNEAGRALLNFAKQSATLRIATRTAAIRSLGATAHRIFEVECRAANLMALAMPIPQPCGMEERRQAIYCDEDSFTR